MQPLARGPAVVESAVNGIDFSDGSGKPQRGLCPSGFAKNLGYVELDGIEVAMNLFTTFKDLVWEGRFAALGGPTRHMILFDDV